MNKEEAIQKSTTTFNSAADYFDAPALSCWNRFGQNTIDRLQLQMKISQRAATAEDIKWLEPFYKSIMHPYYIAMNLVWDDTKFREYFDPQATKIIQADGLDIGMLQVRDREDCIYLGDIQLDHRYRNKGIGTSLIKSVIRSAIAVNKPVRLRVLNGNPAKQLYLRLGFQVIEKLDNCDMLERA